MPVDRYWIRSTAGRGERHLEEFNVVAEHERDTLAGLYPCGLDRGREASGAVVRLPLLADAVSAGKGGGGFLIASGHGA